MKVTLVIVTILASTFFDAGSGAAIEKSTTESDAGITNFYRHYFMRYQMEQFRKYQNERNGTALYQPVMFLGDDEDSTTDATVDAFAGDNATVKYLYLRRRGTKAKAEWDIYGTVEEVLFIFPWILSGLLFLIVAIQLVCWALRCYKLKHKFARLQDKLENPENGKEKEAKATGV